MHTTHTHTYTHTHTRTHTHTHTQYVCGWTCCIIRQSWGVCSRHTHYKEGGKLSNSWPTIYRTFLVSRVSGVCVRVRACMHERERELHLVSLSYSWTILECRGCGEHKGWLFKATHKGLTPSQFYGLRRQCLEHKSSSGNEGGEGGGGGGGGGEGGGRQARPCAPS